MKISSQLNTKVCTSWTYPEIILLIKTKKMNNNELNPNVKYIVFVVRCSNFCKANVILAPISVVRIFCSISTDMVGRYEVIVPPTTHFISARVVERKGCSIILMFGNNSHFKVLSKERRNVPQRKFSKWEWGMVFHINYSKRMTLFRIHKNV